MACAGEPGEDPEGEDPTLRGGSPQLRPEEGGHAEGSHQSGLPLSLRFQLNPFLLLCSGCCTMLHDVAGVV